MSDLSIYISHTREQSTAVRRLRTDLTSRGYSIAVNRHTVPAGERVQPAIERAMAAASRCLFCFSAKPGGPAEYETRDVEAAAAHVRQQSEGQPWLLPVKLTACDIPPLEIGGIQVDELAAIELDDDFTEGLERLLSALPAAPEEGNALPKAGAAAEGASNPTELRTTVKTVQGRDVTVTNLDGAASANGRMELQVDSIVSEHTTSFTNVRRSRS